MICGIDIDALLGGLQDQLTKAKEKALGMVTSTIADAKAEADAMKSGVEGELRAWLPKFPPDLPPLPGLPVSVPLLEMAGKLKSLGQRLENPELTAEEKALINKEIGKVRKAFEDEWGPALDKAGVSLDKILVVINGPGSFDPCALIPNIQKGVDGLMKELPKIPKFPFEEGLTEIESVISETTEKASSAFKEYNAELDGQVTALASQVAKATGDAEIKLARKGIAVTRAPFNAPPEPVYITPYTPQGIRDWWPKPPSMGFGAYETEVFSMLREKNGLIELVNKNKKSRYERTLATWNKQQKLLGL
jgi:hypothetical protein